MNDEKKDENLYDKIKQFIIDLSGCENVNEETDIFFELGLTGDDFHELIENYSEKFNVNIETYLWYFHGNEEGQSLGGIFIKAPNERVSRIPVTPQMLFEFAKSGKWQVNYPEHKLPKKRYDIYINLVVIAFIILLIIWKYIF